MDTTGKPNTNMSQQELFKAKIEMWTKKLEDLQNEYNETKMKRGEAAKEGDLRENAAYAQLTEEAEVLSARMNDIQKMIEKLEETEAAK